MKNLIKYKYLYISFWIYYKLNKNNKFICIKKILKIILILIKIMILLRDKIKTNINRYQIIKFDIF